MKHSWRIARQQGQSMVEYTIVLVFGVMVLTTGPGGDVTKDLLDVIKSNFEGYSYAVSLSEYPDHDTLYDYLNDPDVLGGKLDPGQVIAELQKPIFSQFPTLEDFPDDLLPSGPGDLLDGAVSLF